MCLSPRDRRINSLDLGDKGQKNSSLHARATIDNKREREKEDIWATTLHGARCVYFPS